MPLLPPGSIFFACIWQEALFTLPVCLLMDCPLLVVPVRTLLCTCVRQLRQSYHVQIPRR